MKPPSAIAVDPIGLSPDGSEMRYRITADPAAFLCTGVSAAWCPIHGQCICDRDEGNDDEDPACPLHGTFSKHADAPNDRTPPGITDEDWRAMQEISRVGFAYTAPATFAEIRRENDRFDTWIGKPIRAPVTRALLGEVRLLVIADWPPDRIGIPGATIPWRRAVD